MKENNKLRWWRNPHCKAFVLWQLCCVTTVLNIWCLQSLAVGFPAESFNKSQLKDWLLFNWTLLLGHLPYWISTSASEISWNKVHLWPALFWLYWFVFCAHTVGHPLATVFWQRHLLQLKYSHQWLQLTGCKFLIDKSSPSGYFDCNPLTLYKRGLT